MGKTTKRKSQEETGSKSATPNKGKKSKILTKPSELKKGLDLDSNMANKQVKKINIPNRGTVKDVRRVLIKPSETDKVEAGPSKNNNAVPDVNRTTRSKSKLSKVNKVTQSEFDSVEKLTDAEMNKIDQVDITNDDKILSDSEEEGEVDHDGIEVDVQPAEDDLDRDMQPNQSVMQRLTKEDLLKLKDDPYFQRIVDQMLDEKLKAISDKTDSPVVTTTPATKSKPSPIRVPGIKSPSDSTLYTPAVQRMTNVKQTDYLLNKITSFVEGIRMDEASSRRDRRSADPPVATTVEHQSKDRSPEPPELIQSDYDVEPEPERAPTEFERTQEKADDLILQAEQFKATVSAPKGIYQSNQFMGFPSGNSGAEFSNPFNLSQIRSKFVTDKGLAPVDNQIQWLRNFDQDDEFFHVTCHVDDALKGKITRGEFIDLEKLLPKEKIGISGGKVGGDDNSIFKFGMKEGHPFVTPANDSSGKITSVRRRDQAFRVYAAIYTDANMSRASEVWQYVYVIHTAASSMPWENVAYYDYTFRQLMASKPWRSWAKTYTQGWNLAMRGSSNGGGMFGGNSHHNSHNFQSNPGNGNRNKQSQSQSHDWRDDCCRRFNKNHCKRTSTECRWDHRCTYCGIWNHGKYNCRKRSTKDEGRKPTAAGGAEATTSGKAST